MLIIPICLFVLLFPIIGVILSWAELHRSPHKWKKYFCLFIYPVFIFAYCVEPSYANDLSRYFDQVVKFGNYPLRQAFSVMSDGLVMRDLLFWGVAQTGDVHLLPAITTSLFYAVCLFITCDSAQRLNKQSLISVVMVFEVLVIPFFNVVCNVRNVTAFVIICYASYRDFVEKKRDILLIALYILPCFLHKTGIILLLLRLFVIVFEKYRFLSLALVFGLPTMIDFSYGHISWIRGSGIIQVILRRLIRSAHNYLYDDSDYVVNMKNSGFGIIRITVFVIIIILAYYCYEYIKNNEKSEYTKFITFAFELCIMTLACGTFDAPAYWRFAVVAYIACAPVLLIGLSRDNDSIHINNTMFYVLGGLALMRFAMSLRHTWTRMDFDIFITNSLLTNIFTIIAKIVSIGSY